MTCVALMNLDVDKVDYARESYVCDGLEDDDSGAKPPEMPTQDWSADKKYIIFPSCLIKHLNKGQVCGGSVTTVETVSSGTMICATTTCSKHHVMKCK